MDETNIQRSILSFESSTKSSGTKIIKPWKTKLFRLIREMDLSQTLESSFGHSIIILLQTLQMIYYNLAIYVPFPLLAHFLNPRNRDLHLGRRHQSLPEVLSYFCLQQRLRECYFVLCPDLLHILHQANNLLLHRIELDQVCSPAIN